MVTTSAELPSIPFDQPDILAMAPLLRGLQADRPIVRVRTSTGDEAWLVTRHNEVSQLSADDRLGLAHRDRENAPRASDSAFFGPGWNFDTEFADWTRMRTLLAPHFSPRPMRAFAPRVEALAGELIGALEAAGPPADLHDKLSVPLPMLVICHLVGAPAEDSRRLRELTQRVADQTSRPLSEAARDELISYTRRLVARKRTETADDVISRLCAAEGGTLSSDYIAFLAAVILFAGHENTVVKIDYGALLMIQCPAQRQRVIDDPDRLNDAVEEILRAGTSGTGGGLIRYAREDLMVGGVQIRAGDLVLLDIGAANHDRDVFTDPDQFDVARPAGEHLTFGHGPHYCLGAPLARAELRAVFGGLFRRLPGLRLAVPLGQLEIRHDLVTGGLASLPVAW